MAFTSSSADRKRLLPGTLESGLKRMAWWCTGATLIAMRGMRLVLPCSTRRSVGAVGTIGIDSCRRIRIAGRGVTTLVKQVAK